MEEDKNWQESVISNLINKDKDLKESNDEVREQLDLSTADMSDRLHTFTGYETTEFTTDDSLHLRSKGKKFAVDFNKEQSGTETETDARLLLNQNELGQPSNNHDDVENLYTTEMEEGEENDLKTRKSIIRSELADGTINE